MRPFPVLSALPEEIPAGFSLRRPGLVAVRVPPLDAGDPASLDRAVCELDLVPNPALVGHLARHRLRPTRRGFTGTLRGRLEELLAPLPRRNLVGPFDRRRVGTAGQRSRTDIHVELTDPARPLLRLVPRPDVARLLASSPLTPLQLFELCEQDPDLPIVDASTVPVLNRLAATFRACSIVLPDAGDPSLVRMHLPGGTWSRTDPLTALRLTVPDGNDTVPGGLFIHDAVVDAAEMLLAGGSGREQLTGTQDEFCSVFAATRHGAVCALPAGSGKTAAACVCLAEAAAPGQLAVLAVPAALVTQWQNELARWAPHLAVAPVAGTSPAERNDAPPQVLLGSFDDVAAHGDELAAAGVHLFVVDEARALLTSSARATSLRALCAHARRVLLLTATPDETRRGDAARLLSIARHATCKVAPHPFLFSRTAAGELAPFRYEPLTVRVPPVERAALDAQLAAQMPQLTSRSAVQRAAAVTRVRALLAAVPQKIPALLAHLDGPRPGPVVLVGDFLEPLHAAAAACRAAGMRTALLDGRTTRLQRAAALAALHDGTLDLLVVAPSAARGLDVPAAAAVVHLDVPSSAAQFLQRSARIRRLNSRFDEARVVTLAAHDVERAAFAALAPALEDPAHLCNVDGAFLSRRLSAGKARR